MSQVVSSQVFINGIAVEFLFPWVLSLGRGAEAMEAKFQCTDDRFEAGVDDELEIEIVCSGPDSVSEDRQKFKRWFVKSRKTVSFGVSEYTIADIRHALSYLTLTKNYNVFSYGGQYRKDSLNQGVRWSARSAVQDAIQTMCKGKIENIVVIFGDIHTLSDEKLPDNLGNSMGGGWFGAKMTEFLPPMLEAIRADLIVDWDGVLWITDRGSKAKKTLENYIHLTGVVGPRDMHWQKPKKIQVLFEQRLERQFAYTQKAEGVTDPARTGDMEIENVLIRPPVTAGGEDAGFDPLADPEFIRMTEFLSEFGLTDPTVAKNFTKPSFFNFEIDDGLTGPEKLARMAADSIIRSYWRRMYRVKDDATDAGDIRKSFADVQLGRLKSDGTNMPMDSVWCHYCQALRLGIPTPDAKGGDPREAVFSVNHIGENLSFENRFSKNAPFLPEWVSQKDLVFQLKENSDVQRVSVKSVYLGHFDEPIQFGTIDEIISGAPLNFESSVGLRQGFNLYVFYHALLAAPHPKIAQGDKQQGRLYVIETAAFEDGEMDLLQTRAMDMTANWRFSSEDVWPGVLLNETELAERAAFITDQIKQSYEQARAGTLELGGINVITQGQVRPFGEIYQMDIKIGNKTPYDIVTSVTVLPEVIPPMNKPKQGVKPEMVL